MREGRRAEGWQLLTAGPVEDEELLTEQEFEYLLQVEEESEAAERIRREAAYEEAEEMRKNALDK